MSKNNSFNLLIVPLTFLFNLSFSISAYAGDIEWSGTYRIGGYSINNSELHSEATHKDFGLHHLILRPKIVVADGLTIYGRFDLLNSAETVNNSSGGAHSQMGQVFGGSDDTSSTPRTITQAQTADALQVTHLYMTLVQEFGSWIAGRAPLHFGLGITHNAGEGLFDHWLDTRDLVGYKIVMGNFFVLPMFGKVNEGLIREDDDITDWMIHLQYENLETDIEMGLFYQKRTASGRGNDAPLGSNNMAEVFGGSEATRTGGFEADTINIYALKDTSTFRFGGEYSTHTAKTGVLNSSGSAVDWSAFAIALEFEYRLEALASKFGLKAGMATGDDPQTTSSYEGYLFDRNYDVAFMMFNYELGQRDFLRTGLITGSSATETSVTQTADVETISNVIYFSPYYKYKLSDRWDMGATLTMAWLQVEPLANGNTSKDLGYEVDLSLNFKPNKRIQWVNQMGLLFPGGAFKAGNTLEAKFAYGFTTKAAISF